MPALALGARCGDDVDGRRVPCACGDVLVASRTLDATDPVTQGPCDGTGLRVDVPAGRPGATLDLAGHTLAGSGYGAGIQVVGGGDGGLTLRGPGLVRGFGVGVLAVHDGLARAERVAVVDNHRDGFRVAGRAFELVDCEAHGSRGDGFALRGHGFRLDGNRATENGRRGFSLAGRAARVGDALGNEAAANGGDGVVVRGRDHRLESPVATGNGGAGIRAQGAGMSVAGAVAQGNRRIGVRASGAGVAVPDAFAADNAAGDVDVRGAGSCAGAGCR